MLGLECNGRTITLRFIQKNGKEKTITQDKVPMYKADEYNESEAKLQEIAKENNGFVSAAVYDKMRRDFIAGLFDDEIVTGDFLLENLDTLDMKGIEEIIKYRVLCQNKEEDEFAKKLQQAQILAGLNQETTSEKR